MTTKEELNNRLKRLNAYTKQEYGFNYAYGGVMLTCKNDGCDVSYRLSKPKMLDLLDQMLKVIELEKWGNQYYEDEEN